MLGMIAAEGPLLGRTAGAGLQIRAASVPALIRASRVDETGGQRDYGKRWGN